MAEPCLLIIIFVTLGMILPLFFPCTPTQARASDGAAVMDARVGVLRGGLHTRPAPPGRRPSPAPPPLSSPNLLHVCSA